MSKTTKGIALMCSVPMFLILLGLYYSDYKFIGFIVFVTTVAGVFGIGFKLLLEGTIEDKKNVE